MPKLSSIRSPIAWGLATGLLFSTSYPPFPAWALFFAFVPLWVYWFRATEMRQVVISGFVAQFTLTLIGFNWVAHTSIEYGHIPVIPSFLILIGFCCFASLNVLFAGIIAWGIQRKWPLPPVWFFLLVAVISGACDWLYPTIFPWNTGYPLLYNKFHGAQLAEFIGFNLLGTCVYMANAAFALSYVRFPARGWSRPLIVFILGLFVFEFLGTATEMRLPPEDKKVTALLIQPNIGNYDKFFAERGNGYQEPVIKKDFEITEEGIRTAGKKIDLIIWPETAYPESLDPWFKDRYYVKELQKFVDDHHLPLITGSYSSDDPQGSVRKDYNAVFALQPGGTLQPGYRKQLLLAFGEYFPGAEYFPFLKKIVPEISDFGRGVGLVTFNLAGAKFLPLICYEGLDTGFVRKALSGGGDIFVNVTNDSWFGKNFEPRQHMIMTVARTIEYRRPLVRVTNTGITIVADMRGHLLTQGPQEKDWTTVAEIPYAGTPANTVFSVINPFISVIFTACALVLFFLGRRYGNKPRT